jgi:hypothetical protein
MAVRRAAVFVKINLYPLTPPPLTLAHPNSGDRMTPRNACKFKHIHWTIVLQCHKPHDALSKCYQQKFEDHGAAIKQLIVKQMRYCISNHQINDQVAVEVKWFRIFCFCDIFFIGRAPPPPTKYFPPHLILNVNIVNLNMYRYEYLHCSVHLYMNLC